MFNRNRAKTLTILIILFPLISLMIYGGSTYLFIFFTQKKENEKSLIAYKTILMDIEKERLKEKVKSLSQFINYYDSRSSQKIKEDVKNIVSVTVDVANNIYDSYKDTKSEKEIKKMIISALDTIKFEGDIGYLFVLNLKGDTILHVDKKMQGTNILEIQDIYGKYIIKEFNKVLAEKGEGYVDYYWYIKSRNKKNMHYKISYVKMLKAYDWYVGAGEYLKYMTKFVKRDIINYISSNSNFSHGHFFLFDSNDNMIFKPSSSNIKNLKPYKKDGFYTTNSQLSYVHYIKEYDWYLVGTRDLEDIKKQIAINKKTMSSKQSSDMHINIYLLVSSWLISILLSLYLSIIINKLLKEYEKKLNDSNEKLIFQSRQAIIGELFSMIAHQWRQPINKIASILLSIRFAIKQEKVSLLEVDTKCVEIEDSIEFMSETIDDFRTFYKPKNDCTKVNLKTLIEQSLSFVESNLKQKSITLDKKLEDVEYELFQNEFVQVMLNLMKNAIDAVNNNGIINIELYQDKVSTYISIENNHVEDALDLSKIFDPYYTTKEKSTGLGLYMVKIIIEKHMNGSIEAELIKDRIVFKIKLP